MAEAGPPPPYRILVIDDDPGLRELIAEILTAGGHAVLEADSGEAGCALALAERPDLILVDYAMPGLNGVATVQRLKAERETRHIPVIALTATTGSEYHAMTEAGCIGYIPKPFSAEELTRLVRDFLNATAGRRRGVPPA